jgi:hypothetical protein
MLAGDDGKALLQPELEACGEVEIVTQAGEPAFAFADQARDLPGCTCCHLA